MFANIRRHQTWLLYVIIGATILSFTWYLNPSNRGNRGGGGGGMFENNVGSINGRPIGRGEYLDTQKESQLKYLFTYGSWYGSDEFSRQNEGFLERETRQRLFLKEKAKDFGIHVTPTNVAEWIREQLGRERAFTQADYDALLQKLAPQGITEQDFNRYVRDEIAIMHLVQVAGTPGRLVTPQEAEVQYRRENQQVSADAVYFGMSNYVSQVPMDANLIAAHYTNQQQNFRVPDKVQLAYVEFPASNYWANAEKTIAGTTNLNQILDQMYQQRGTNYYTDATGAPMTPDAAKAKIREEQRDQLALRDARKAATDFAEALLDMPVSKRIENLDAVAKTNNLVVKVTEPFSQFETPKEMPGVEQIGPVAFKLTPAEPFIEQTINGSDAVYVAGFKNKIPSAVPPLESILDRVTEDYKRMQSRQLAQQAGFAFQSKITNTMGSGKTFTVAATELGHTPMNLAPFSQTVRTITGLDPRIDPGAVKNAAFALKDGETSQFMPLGTGGFVVHVNNFIPVNDADLKKGLPEYMAGLQKAGQTEAFSEWFTKEIQTAKITLVTDKKTEKGGAPQSDTQ